MAVQPNTKGYGLGGKRVVITQANSFMGPHLVEAFTKEGADVIPDQRDLTHDKAADNLVCEVKDIDVLVINLATDRFRANALELTDLQFHQPFEEMVYPLFRLGRSVLPQMIARRSGKIIVMGSAAPLRAFPNASAYASARGAQLAWVKAVGVEVAPHNVQVNAIGFFSGLVSEYQVAKWNIESLSGRDDCRILSLKYSVSLMPLARLRIIPILMLPASILALVSLCFA